MIQKHDAYNLAWLALGPIIIIIIIRGALLACSRVLTDIFQAINNKPSASGEWRRLLWFASNILEQPPRAGRRRNMANVVKKRIENREFMKVYDKPDHE